MADTLVVEPQPQQHHAPVDHPQDLDGDNDITFESLGVKNESLLLALQAYSDGRPLEVQKQVIPQLMNQKGGDVIVCSPPGSGKTLAYAIPVIEMVDPDKDTLQAIVVVPHGELALQQAAILQDLVRFTCPQHRQHDNFRSQKQSEIHIMALTNVDYREKKDEIKRRTPHILVGQVEALNYYLFTLDPRTDHQGRPRPVGYTNDQGKFVATPIVDPRTTKLVVFDEVSIIIISSSMGGRRRVGSIIVRHHYLP